MLTIVDVLAVPGTGAYYLEDLTALREAPLPADPGRAVREFAEVVSVGLALSDGRIAWGDCVPALCGRQAGPGRAFRAEAGCATVAQVVRPALIGRPVAAFRDAAARLSELTDLAVVEAPRGGDAARTLSRRAFLTAAFRPPQEPAAVLAPRPLSPAIHYGLSQALLAASALAQGVTPAEVIAAEWGLPRPAAAVPLHGQCGGDRYGGADRLIVRRAASLPHPQFDDLPAQPGSEGDELVRYVRWLSGRIGSLGGADYRPTIHLDLRGGLGRLFGENLGRILGVLHGLETAARPYAIRVANPLIAPSRAAQIAALKQLRDYIRLRKMKIELVADAWTEDLDDIRAFIHAAAADMIQVTLPGLGGIQNAVDAVLACRTAGAGVLLAGGCAETDLSARMAVHVALAARPDLLMACPGLGVDEAWAITGNEMARTLARIGRQQSNEAYSQKAGA